MTAPAVASRFVTVAAHPETGLPVYCFTLPGAIRTKKNSSRIVRLGKRTDAKLRVMPSKAFVEWERTVVGYASTKPELALGLAVPLNCCATFYRDAERGDAVGYYQALADALQTIGVVVDDKWVVSWDGSRLAKSAARPRVEVTLTVLDGALL